MTLIQLFTAVMEDKQYKELLFKKNKEVAARINLEWEWQYFDRLMSDPFIEELKQLKYTPLVGTRCLDPTPVRYYESILNVGSHTVNIQCIEDKEPYIICWWYDSNNPPKFRLPTIKRKQSAALI